MVFNTQELDLLKAEILFEIEEDNMDAFNNWFSELDFKARNYESLEDAKWELLLEIQSYNS